MLTRQCTEMEKVRQWIRFASSQEALKVSEKDAYELRRNILRSQERIGGRSAYIDFPPANADKENDSRTAAMMISEIGSTEDSSQHKSADSTHDAVNTPEEMTVDRNPLLDEHEAETNGAHLQQNNLSGYDELVKRILETAADDMLFLLLCKVDDEKSDCMLGLASSSLLKFARERGICTEPLLKMC